MKKYIAFLILSMILIPSISFAVMIGQGSDSSETFYVYMVKSYVLENDVSIEKPIMLSFEFNSMEGDKNRFREFSKHYIGGLESGDWKRVFFLKSHFRNKLHSCRKEGYIEKTDISGIVYFLLPHDREESRCFDSVFSYEIFGANPDVVVNNGGDGGRNTFSYLDFTDEDRLWNQVGHYKKTDILYGQLVSEKIDRAIKKIFRYVPAR
ncbi:hypothetical protein C0584_00605 [Candidatus Parcubacteria bacterium]|nr:MAG: hypothetical protein C0584_00605 [Candidatus Parcubacteria bacterium]